LSTFVEMLQAKWDEGKFVCVGLDSDTKKLPSRIPKPTFGESDVPFGTWGDQAYFNKAIVDATHDLVCAYKPNLAFYRGDLGKKELQTTITYIKYVAPDIQVILDAKQADIGNTNDGYVEEDFDWYGADAVTVHPYLGMEAMKPFLDRADKGIVVLCRTSNSGAGEFQDLPIYNPHTPVRTDPLYQIVASNVSHDWNYNGNCAVVVGATYPEELAEVRQIVGEMPILIPGIGAQGGDLEATVLAGRNSKNQGMIINSSRGIIFASGGEDFAEAARSETQKLHDAINATLAAA
jgi:orotidine-5'-phosphate decarboxylase